jgi:hypothetical protein
MKTILKFASIALLVGFISCKKDTKEPEPTPEPTPAATTGSLKIKFEHLVGTTPLVFNQNYVNPKLDTFKVSKLKYYISNVVITKNDNSTFVVPESYYLLDASNPVSTVLTLTNVPFASYKSISFMLGVDSARSASGAQTGALSQSNGMYWNWSSGYVMFKLEGSSPQAGAPNKQLIYHLGGYGGVYKTQRSFILNFGSPTANVSSGTTPMVHLSVDINEFFKNPVLIDVATQYYQMAAGVNAKMYADNYADMISFGYISN